MAGPAHTTQVLALPGGLPAPLVDEILTAAEAALLRHGATRIRLDTAQRALVVVADLPERDAAASDVRRVSEARPEHSGLA